MIKTLTIPLSLGRFGCGRSATFQASDFRSACFAAWRTGRRYINRTPRGWSIGDDRGGGEWYILDPRLRDVLRGDDWQFLGKAG